MRRSRQPSRTHDRKRSDETFEVEVERILPGGAGLAHAGGKTILVGLAAPGDLVRVRVRKVKGRTAFASIEEIIKPSPVRIEPPCPYFGRCGGCDFQQLSYEAQLDAKVEMVRDCLRRIAGIDFPEKIPIHASPLEWRYRSRAQWQYDAMRNHLGYFERGTHNVCDVIECPVLVPSLQETLSRLREHMRNGSLPDDANEFQSVAGDEGASLVPPLVEVSSPEASMTINEFRYRFRADGFFQINQSLLPQLIKTAIVDMRGEVAVDLYCGAGLFTLPLAEKFNRVLGVEVVETAAGYARRNLEGAGFANASVEVSAVSTWLQSNAHTLSPVDLVLLDPPRTGAEPGAIKGILALRPRSIVYVSCDPATLARDLKELLAGDYSLDSIAAFDMFPQTHHVETVARLATTTVNS
ncbi:MAG TPA: class I SAM-dependent RNA methyltransferase [Pyrinomonadaceae bacterium]|nr:class I SAM-dependent RNA methyltransferase [Pyrinomonadaceae bacterium]